MPFEIRTLRHFSAAHQLRLYDQSLEPLHGHNWKVEVAVASPDLDSIGVVMDFHELERLVDEVIIPWHNQHLNNVPPFNANLNSSAENVALALAKALKLPQGIRLLQVQIWETDSNSATYRP